MSVFRGFLLKRVCNFSIAPSGEWAEVTKSAQFASQWIVGTPSLLLAPRKEAFWVKSASLPHDRAPFSCFAWRVHRRCQMLRDLSLWRARLCVGDGTISHPLTGVNVLVGPRETTRTVGGAGGSCVCNSGAALLGKSSSLPASTSHERVATGLRNSGSTLE
jgi:hypothetical protein